MEDILTKAKDIAVRAVKTFGEAAVGYISLEVSGGFDWCDNAAMKTLLMGACSAGIAALLNLALAALESGKNKEVQG